MNESPDLDDAAAPDFINVYKLEDFELLLKEAGFVVQTAFYFDQEGADYIHGDGRAQTAYVAIKPH
jgi:hypothetical protein